MNVTFKDFQLINTWEPDVDGPCWPYTGGTPKVLIDKATGRKYLNESKGVIRNKCNLLVIGTPLIHPIAAVVNVVYRILKLITLSHFWVGKELDYNFKARLGAAGKDLLRIIVAPLSLVGLELAALYGVVRPYDGRKLYASIERAIYGYFILAPCFQPDAKYHAFGGDIAQRNAF